MNPMPSSLADLMAQFSSAAPMSEPSSAPAPLPVEPMPSASVLGPSAALSAPPKPGTDWGGIAKKSLPMVLALMARKQGGPLAGASMLEGYSRGEQQRKQAERDAFELEMQTIEDTQEREARQAAFERTRAIQRESWVRALQEDLAKLNDPEQFAATVSLAEKFGAPIHDIDPAQLRQQFKFPDSRSGIAARDTARARLTELKKIHGNFDELLRTNAIDKTSGKSLRDIMATAELLVVDDQGAPMLPPAKDDLQIPNNEAGFDFRVELAAEEEKLGRKLKPGERSALRRRLVNEEEARLRGRRVPRASAGGTRAGGGSTSASGSFIDQIMETPAIYHDMTGTEKNKYRAALARRGFTKWARPAGGNSNAMAPEKAAEIGAEMLRVARALRTTPGFNGAFGTLDASTPTFRQSTADAEVLRDRLINLLTLDNMGLIKGVLSESDMAILKSASSAITPRMSEAAARAELDRLIPIFEKASKAVSISGDSGLDLDVQPEASRGPQIGERRMINGALGEWDGRGWKPVGGGR